MGHGTCSAHHALGSRLAVASLAELHVAGPTVCPASGSLRQPALLLLLPIVWAAVGRVGVGAGAARSTQHAARSHAARSTASTTCCCCDPRSHPPPTAAPWVLGLGSWILDLEAGHLPRTGVGLIKHGRFVLCAACALNDFISGQLAEFRYGAHCFHKPADPALFAPLLFLLSVFCVAAFPPAGVFLWLLGAVRRCISADITTCVHHLTAHYFL
jgi:hypothetical protein